MRSHFYLLNMTAFRLSPPLFFGLELLVVASPKIGFIYSNGKNRGFVSRHLPY